MQRPPLTLVALAITAAFLPMVRAQNPPDPQKPAKRTDLPADDSIWGYGWIGGEYPVGGPPPVPVPIVPQEWLVVPRANGNGLTELLARAIDPAGRPPAAGDTKWEARHGQPLADVACAFTRVECASDEVRMARLSGAGLLFVNGTGFVGDAEQRGFRGVPIPLKTGLNELYVFDIRGSFELELWSPVSRTVIGTWDVGWPEAADMSADLTFPVFNASRDSVDGLHVHYGHARVEGGSCKPSLTDWRDGGRMLPLGLRIGASYFWGMDECDPPSLDKPLVAPICVWADDDGNADRQLVRWSGVAAARPKVRPPNVLANTPLLRLDASPLLVYGSRGTLARARFDQESIWYRAGHVPEAISHKELAGLPPETQPDGTDWHIRQADNASRYVLYGNAETNEAWSRFVADDSPIQVHEGHLVVNGKHYASDDICGWFKLKTARYEDVLVIADTGVHGARLGYLVQPLLGDAANLEYAFWDSRGADGGPRRFEFAERKH